MSRIKRHCLSFSHLGIYCLVTIVSYDTVCVIIYLLLREKKRFSTLVRKSGYKYITNVMLRGNFGLHSSGLSLLYW